MARWWDSDKTIARGAAPGTRAGRPVSLQSGPARREPSGEPPDRLRPPRGALAVFRPRLSLLRPKQWIALTADGLEARAGDRILVMRRGDVQAIQVMRHGQTRIVFLGRSGRALGSVPAAYATAQIEALARLLGVRILDS